MRISLEFISKLTINPDFEKNNLPRSLLIHGNSVKTFFLFHFYYSDCFIHRVTPRVYFISTYL